MAKQKIKWLDAPEPHDYPAAEAYLSLFLTPDQAKAIVKQLRAAPMTTAKSKDIRRASGLDLLGESNAHVKANLKKIKRGVPLSPVLLARVDRRLVIADGWHRVSAVHKFSEDAEIPIKIV